jgi:uncharacterized membrane protein
MNSPLKISFKSEIVSILLVLAGVITSAVSFGRLPARVVSHWNVYGVPDGWMSRELHAILFPGILLGLYLLLLFMSSIDPKKDRYKEFADVYNIFRTLILLVLYSVFLIATLANLGYDISVGKTVPLIIGLLMIVIGNYMGKIKKNWFVGIRTPWTLSSENVWNKTHRLGGWMFVLFGLILITSPFLSPAFIAPLFILGLICAVLIPIIYSYILFKNEKE